MRTSLFALSSACTLLIACRGDYSSSPPVHLQQNMFLQKRFEMQQENPFFSDDRAMRLPVEGTVAVDELKLDDRLYRGKQVKVPKGHSTRSSVPAGSGVAEVEYEDVRTLPPFDERGRPLVVDEAFLERGQQRFQIYCSVCHGLAGDGDGINVIKGFVQPPAFWEARLIGAPIGHFFDVMSNGRGNMSSYASQVSVRDRWAIAAYIRTLQRRRDNSLERIPDAVAKAKGWSKQP